MSPVEFEPTVPASERPQSHALDRAATGNGIGLLYSTNNPGRSFKVQRNGYKTSCLISLLNIINFSGG